MSDTAVLLLLFLGVPAGLLAAVLLSVCLDWAVWHLGHAVAQCQSRLDDWRLNVAEQSERTGDHRTFLQWLASKTGQNSVRATVDQELVEAQHQSEAIRALVEQEVPKAILRCVETHRLMAAVTGALNMFEIAYEPECYQLRAGVVWLLSHTVEFLQAYPLRLDDARLLHNSILLRKRALPTCLNCPYIQLRVDQAPRLCPTAELVQLRGSHDEHIA